jgi:hypothetical protein
MLTTSETVFDPALAPLCPERSTAQRPDRAARVPASASTAHRAIPEESVPADHGTGRCRRTGFTRPKAPRVGWRHRRPDRTIMLWRGQQRIRRPARSSQVAAWKQSRWAAVIANRSPVNRWPTNLGSSSTVAAFFPMLYRRNLWPVRLIRAATRWRADRRSLRAGRAWTYAVFPWRSCRNQRSSGIR